MTLAAIRPFHTETEIAMDQLGDKPEEVRKRLEDKKRRAERKRERQSAPSREAEPAERSEPERTRTDDKG